MPNTPDSKMRVARAEGRSLEDAVCLAAGAGALATRQVGARASLPDRAELESFADTGRPV